MSRTKAFVAAVLLVAAPATIAATMGTSFTYQGQLKHEGIPVTGNAHIEFRVWKTASGGSSIGTSGPVSVDLVNGLFTTQVDFGAGIFDGDARWLEVRVEYPPGTWTSLSPRQSITPTPYALMATVASELELPFSATTNSASNALSVTQEGLGRVADFRTSSAVSENPTIYAEQAGMGRCGHFRITNASNDLEAVAASTTGAGAALSGYTIGSGPAVHGQTDGVGVAGEFIGKGGHNRAYLGGDHAALESQGDAVVRDGALRLLTSGGIETVQIVPAEVASNGGQILLRKANGTQTIQVDAEYGTGGGAYVALAGGENDPALRVDGAGAGRNEAALRVNNSRADQGMAGYFTNSSTFATVHIQNGGSGETLWLENDGGGDLIVARTPERWQFWVDGEGYTNSRVLRIHGGADLSEGFTVRAATGKSKATDTPRDTAPLPGMVVCIDPEHAGRLVVSSDAYDKKVAGIISGAGGIHPGMLMGQGGSEADGAQPVALTGRVYGLCTASNGPIEPGDLLTTSETPGRAMKATNDERSRGAVIGKAMSSLPTGEGLVLVLVSLQ